MPKAKARRVDPLEEQLQAQAAAVISGETDDFGRMPGETRARGQVPELDEQDRAARGGDDMTKGGTVRMVKDGNVIDVEIENVEANSRMGFVRVADVVAEYEQDGE